MGAPYIPPQADDTIAFLTLRLHANGTMTLNGHVADHALMLQMLDHARDTIKRQIPSGGIIIPSRDVDVAPSIPLKEFGDIPPGQRGDP